MVLFAKDIVERDFLILPKDMSVLEASKRMKEERHGFTIVGEEKGRPEGIVTEWDILAKVVAEGRDPRDVSLADIMSTNLITVNASDGIANVAQIMAEKGIRRVIVVEGGKAIGIITSRTILARLKDYVDRVSAQISRLQSPWF